MFSRGHDLYEKVTIIVSSMFLALLYVPWPISQGKTKGRSRRDNKEEDLDEGPILPRHRAWEEAQAAVDEADR